MLVFIPPAVPPGEPPTSIQAIESTIAGAPKAAKSSELKPAVRSVTDWNRDASHFDPSSSGASVRPASNPRNRSIPATIRNAVVASAARCSQSKGERSRVVARRPSRISSTKPRPPSTISAAITRLVGTSATRPVSDAFPLNSEKPALQNADTAWNAAQPPRVTASGTSSRQAQNRAAAPAASIARVTPTIRRSSERTSVASASAIASARACSWRPV